MHFFTAHVVAFITTAKDCTKSFNMTVKEDPEQVRVVAPSTLAAGYTFKVEVDGRDLTVKVPEGGVEEGQSFDAEVVSSLTGSSATNPDFVAVTVEPVADAAVPVAAAGGPIITKTIVNNPDGTQNITEETKYPDGRVTTKTTTTTPAAQAATAGAEATAFAVPTGAWRHQLFSCFDTCSSGVFWMSWCCGMIALGQLLQRMKKTFIGTDDSSGSYKQTCMIWTIICIVAYVIGVFLVNVSRGVSFYIVYGIAGILFLVAATQVRFSMRQKYSIPADCCSDSGCLSDCCCVYWCSCCSVIQMMRHTHDEKKYVYNCTSQTGLGPNDPEIV